MSCSSFEFYSPVLAFIRCILPAAIITVVSNSDFHFSHLFICYLESFCKKEIALLFVYSISYLYWHGFLDFFFFLSFNTILSLFALLFILFQLW